MEKQTIGNIKPIKNINIKFRGIDDWNRPVFKDIDSNVYFGSVNKLFTHESIQEIVNYFIEHYNELEFFGYSFNCEPHGGLPSNYRLNIIDKVPLLYVITGKDRSGKRFKIETNTPQHYNIWIGTLWKQDINKKRTKIKTY